MTFHRWMLGCKLLQSGSSTPGAGGPKRGNWLYVKMRASGKKEEVVTVREEMGPNVLFALRRVGLGYEDWRTPSAGTR
jgi:hypothetical protein